MTSARQLLTRARRGHPSRITRFHSGRDELMPLSAWLTLPRLLIGRIAGRQAKIPWIIPAAAKRLNVLLQQDWRVLELGSGSSTLWLAERAGHVTSLEDDGEWHRVCVERAADLGLNNVDLLHCALHEFSDHLRALRETNFDLVIVDCNEAADGLDRPTFVREVVNKVRPGGYLLFDDSDRPDYRGADLAVLDGWPSERFVGMKTYPWTASETTIYKRPVS